MYTHTPLRYEVTWWLMRSPIPPSYEWVKLQIDQYSISLWENGTVSHVPVQILSIYIWMHSFPDRCKKWFVLRSYYFQALFLNIYIQRMDRQIQRHHRPEVYCIDHRNTASRFNNISKRQDPMWCGNIQCALKMHNDRCRPCGWRWRVDNNDPISFANLIPKNYFTDTSSYRCCTWFQVHMGSFKLAKQLFLFEINVLGIWWNRSWPNPKQISFKQRKLVCYWRSPDATWKSKVSTDSSQLTLMGLPTYSFSSHLNMDRNTR